MGKVTVYCIRNRRVYKREFEDSDEAMKYFYEKLEKKFVCFIG